MSHSTRTAPGSEPELSPVSTQPYGTWLSASSDTQPTDQSTSQPRPANSPVSQISRLTYLASLLDFAGTSDLRGY
ncbi:MAG: hypothetical protein ACYDGY_08975 [Acidimicrobiales bacterium]